MLDPNTALQFAGFIAITVVNIIRVTDGSTEGVILSLVVSGLGIVALVILGGSKPPPSGPAPEGGGRKPVPPKEFESRVADKVARGKDGNLYVRLAPRNWVPVKDPTQDLFDLADAMRDGQVSASIYVTVRTDVKKPFAIVKTIIIFGRIS